MAGSAHDPLVWLSAKQKRFARLASRWPWTAWLLWLLCLAPLAVILASRDNAPVRVEATITLLLVGTLVVAARIVLKPGERARRYNRAERILEEALVRDKAGRVEGVGGLENADAEAQRLLGEPFKTQY
jgi:hypothetical protein